MSIYHAILEIEAHANGGKKDVDRYLNAINTLRHSHINNHNILGVITQPNEQPTNVKHFGYDYRCIEHCNHEPSAYGVLRYFGITLVIEPSYKQGMEHTMFGDYKINEYSRITICGHDMPFDGERKQLQEVK